MLKIFKFLIFSTILHIFTFMLVEKSWYCYNWNVERGKLKQKVLKALANPPRIFYVPYTLALLNFMFWFLFFVVSMIVFLLFPPHNVPMWLPLAFLGLLGLSHMILGFYSRQDTQISQLIFSGFNIIKKRIPRRLVV